MVHDYKVLLCKIECFPYSPQSKRVSVEVQCDPVEWEEQAARLKETLSINSQLSDDLAAAHKQIEQLKSSLKELEVSNIYDL